MILDACWSDDGKVFITVSRDKTAKVWAQGPNGDWSSASTIKLAEGISAVEATAIASEQAGGDLVALGTESGAIELYRMDRSSTDGQVSLEKVGQVDVWYVLAFWL
jgi:WD40 repeat protein